MCDLCFIPRCDCDAALADGQATDPNAAAGSAVLETPAPTVTDALALDSTQYWTGDTVRYAFPDTAMEFTGGLSYYSPYNEPGAPETLSAFGRDSLREGVAQWDAVTALTIAEAPSGTMAEINVGASSVPSTAWAYYPGDLAANGDIWFNTGKWFLDDLAGGPAPIIGSYAYATGMHEFGHALGLKHPHQVSGGGTAVLDPAYDAVEFSIMSYRSYPGGSVGGYTLESWGYPQTPMMLDIAMIQQIYGADYTTQAGDTTYTVSATTGEMFVDGVSQGVPGANRVFRTLWDGDGTDHIDLSNYATSMYADLNPGRGIRFDTDGNFQAARLASSTYAGFNIYMSLLHEGDTRSLIENLTTGTGDDILIGNAAANVLTSAGGDNTFTGGLGADLLVLGAGADTVADTLAGLDGDRVVGFGPSDRILVEDSMLAAGAVRYDVVTGLLTFDPDLDGTPDAAMTIDPGLSAVDVRVEGTGTILTVTNDPPPPPPPDPVVDGAMLLDLAHLYLTGAATGQEIGGTDAINLGEHVAKTTTLAVTTGADVESLQVLYEQGGGNNGLALYIENGALHGAVWGGGAYHKVSTAIAAETTQGLSLVFDGAGRAISLWIDGVEAASAAAFDMLPRHKQNGAAGEVFGTTVIDGVETGAALAFGGEIHAVAQHNAVFGAAEMAALAGAVTGTQVTLPPDPVVDGAMLLDLAHLYLTGAETGQEIGGTDAINTSDHAAKTTTLAVTTGADVESLQVLYEQGGSANGLALYIENGALHGAVWGGGAYHKVSTAIAAETTQGLSLVFDGAGRAISLWIDGVEAASAAAFDMLPRHTQNGGAGRVVTTTVIDGQEASAALAFGGEIHAVAQHNAVFGAAEMAALAGAVTGTVTDVQGARLPADAFVFVDTDGGDMADHAADAPLFGPGSPVADPGDPGLWQDEVPADMAFAWDADPYAFLG